ncbi:hypothetical protein RAX54_004570 [Vibrio parahaemolyticus]|nr:hypothetical protein [Vibrio parahaemolyticus]
MIDTYQTLIAGVVGFVGVIISILANGFFARKQHGQGIAQRRKSIISAIKAELQSILKVLRGVRRYLKLLQMESERHFRSKYLMMYIKRCWGKSAI